MAENLVTKLATLSDLIDEFVEKYKNTRSTKEEKEKTIAAFLDSVNLANSTQITTLDGVKEMLNNLKADIASKDAENKSLIEKHGLAAGSLNGELAKSVATIAEMTSKLDYANAEINELKKRQAELGVENATIVAANSELSNEKSALESEKSSSQAKIEEIREKINKALLLSEPSSATPDAAPIAPPGGESNPEGSSKGGRRTLRRNGSKRRKNKRRKTTSRWRN